MNPSPVKSFQVDQLPVRSFASLADMAAAAAADAAQVLISAIAAKGRARAIIATGNSQDLFLEKLTRHAGIDWSKVELFHMDEYLGMPMTHRASFRKYLKERVFDRVNPAGANYLEGDALEPLKAIRAYAAALAAKPIDLCCLGIGENGHLAFNDPPVADFADAEAIKIVKLDEGCRQQQVGEGHFPNLDAVPMYAITLTIPTLCKVGRMIAVVPEQRKAAAVKGSLEGPIAPACPGSFLRQQPHAVLYLDADSSSLLTK
ncbi:MAG: glucosamine-6-phosphate deaminase [Opitutaceae bacterium]|nr:glucosamine-6-phosphate deaminase [Opitutaceae bacterium]MBP9913424.1 glucosamine-6-phosphate deaminase [Opitutaceae bacterium]